MKKSLLFGALLAALPLAQAQKTQIAFEEYDLPNGMHVILHQDPTTPIVAVSVLPRRLQKRGPRTHRFCPLF